ncbi:MAG: UDP-N-acetylmuramate dehydrogenase [Lachnospiraceae bacterium]|jgi:UDP-N-acetylmuramate dehydrogenase|nr:UDP-N-acetylmuramate dehydrogenase [Lachnospiraceae bacterium]
MQNKNEWIRKLGEQVEILVAEPMKNHTTFRIGGPADALALPKTPEEVAEVVHFCHEHAQPYYVLGNGSNLLVSDEGYRGLVLQLYRNFNDIQVNGETITVQSGAMLAAVARTAYQTGLTGLEFASGIPGTIGGAVVMNAGAYGGEMKNVLKEVTVLTKEGEVLVIPAKALELGYRTSVIPKNGWIVLGAVLQLKKGDQEQILARMEELKEQRITKQPLDLPSAGSTFKRPEGYFAGKLIMDAGLRGFTVGGAQVSEKHCGFVVNRGNATAADVWELICEVKRRVKEMTGVELEPEVKLLGDFPQR